MMFAHIDNVKIGDILIPDNGFLCMNEGDKLEVQLDKNENELYVPCECGNHYLFGQVDENNGVYLGLRKIDNNIIF